MKPLAPGAAGRKFLAIDLRVSGASPIATQPGERG